ncbi:hypothetical protein TOK_5013 [Pseudonocardia sp. N23]|nr:hypothetical protein TOK_5013 [Pseudonocardia sp. N23]
MARPDMARWASGGIAWPTAETRYELSIVVHVPVVGGGYGAAAEQNVQKDFDPGPRC